MSKTKDISDLRMDMIMLDADYQYYMDMVNTNYPYDFRMEQLINAADVLSDIVFYEELLIKKRHC